MCNPNHTVNTDTSTVKEKKCSGKCKECREKSKNKTLIKTIGLMMLLLLSSAAFAQEAVPAATPATGGFNDPMLPLYVISAFMVIILVLIIVVGFYLISIVNLLTVQAEKERAEKLGVAYAPRTSWWRKFSDSVNSAVPLEQEKSIEFDHSYDGIRELDNHLPPWWKWLFVGTVVWGAIYIFVFHFSTSLPLQEQEYQNELSLAEEQGIKLAASQPQASIDENTLVYSPDAEILSNGVKVFVTNCVACHKADGGGNAIGPNLTDAYWLHGGELKNLYAIIKDGVVEKGMPAWGKAMSPKDVRDVSFYVMSLQGTNPPGAKEPQGVLFTPAAVKADTVKTAAAL